MVRMLSEKPSRTIIKDHLLAGAMPEDVRVIFKTIYDMTFIKMYVEIVECLYQLSLNFWYNYLFEGPNLAHEGMGDFQGT